MGKKIKIANILTSVAYGGLETVNFQLLKTYNRDKYDMITIVLARDDLNENVFIKNLKANNYRYITVSLAQTVKNTWEHILAIFRCFLAVNAIVKDNKFDIIHSNGTLADLICIPISKLN